MIPRLSRSGWTSVALLGAGAAAAFAYGLATEPARAWGNFLTASFYFLTLALGAMVFLAAMYVANAGWSATLKRVPEALMMYLPVGALTMLAILLGVHDLYHWSHEEALAKDALLAHKEPYLNLPFFTARMAGFLGLWVLFACFLRRNSLRQDADGRAVRTRRNRVVSAVFLLTFAYTFTFACFDWLMSLTPHWYSTIFAFYNMSGLLVAGVAATTVATILLRRQGLLPGVGEGHLVDLGRWLFAFSTFWAYIWLSQYLLIWYANIPEEITYLKTRLEGGWAFLFWLNVVLGWVLPFFALLPRKAKRIETHLLWVCGSLLFGRWVDIYVMVAPAHLPEHPGVGLEEVGVFLGFAALFVVVVMRSLRRASLVPAWDPYIVEALHHRL